MADTEFEEFRQTFDKLPQQRLTTTAAPFYSLVSDIELDEYPSSKSDSSSDQDDDDKMCEILSHISLAPLVAAIAPTTLSLASNNSNNNNNSEQLIDNGDIVIVPTAIKNDGVILTGDANSGKINADTTNILEKQSIFTHSGGFTERRRRKLPEIPKVKKPLVFPFPNANNNFHQTSTQPNQHGITSLADELGCGGLTGLGPHRPINFNTSFSQRSLLTLKCSYLLDEDSSPDSERLHSLGDVDSGHSTSHSPNDFKSMSPQAATSPTSSPFPPPFGGVPMSQIEMLEATHRGLHKFIPRHHDEVDIEIGDPIYVQKEADDLWCEGVNLRTGRQGMFPSAYAVDLDYNDFDPSTVQVKKERYLLGYLGSVETVAHKGTGVVCQAVKKISDEYGDSPKAQPCILEVSDQGLRMVDRSKPKNKMEKGACIDYFYSLKNVSFCAFHPRDHRYIGFITKHPTVQRFACHVFKGHESTRPVAEAVGRAFHRFYQKFIETAYPIEDIYIE